MKTYLKRFSVVFLLSSFFVMLFVCVAFQSLPAHAAVDPTITSAEILDMDDTDNCYAMKKYYSFVAVVNDLDGATNIVEVDLQGKDGETILFQVNAKGLDGATPNFSIEPGYGYETVIDLDTGICSWFESGNEGTATFKIRFHWDHPQKDDCEIAVYVKDAFDRVAGWTDMKTDYFDIINRLVTEGFSDSDTRINRGETVTLSGNVRYATTISGNTASSSYPPNAQFNDVAIHDSAHTEKGTDTTIVNGAFSVSFNIPDAVQSNTYHVFLDLVADYSDADAPDGDTVSVIGDQIIVRGYTVSDPRADINTFVNIDVEIEYGYDSNDVTDGTVIINDIPATHQGLGKWRIPRSKSSPQAETYDTVACSGNTHGITSVNQNGQSETVIWDRIHATACTVDDSRININSAGQIDFTLKYDYDETALTDGTVTINGESATHQGSGVWRITPSKSSVQQVTYGSSASISGNIYGITAYDQNGQSGTITWDRIQVQSYTVADARVNINDNVNTDVLLYYDHDNTQVTDGTVTINGVSATHQGLGTWRIARSKSVVGDETYDTVACSGNTHGITVVDQNSKSQKVIWDRIEVYYLELDDSRVNGGTNIEVRAKARLDYDNHELGSGDSLTFNSGVGTWDGSNGWFEDWRSQSAPSDYAFTVTSASEATYGITEVYIAGSEPKGVWDRIEIYYEQLGDSRVNVGDSIEFRVKARLDYDNHELDSGDSQTANFGVLSWDATNNWFDGTRSQGTVGDYTFTVASGSEATYGITAIWINVENPTGVWDRIKITGLGNDDGRRDVGTTGTLWTTALLEYDDHALGSGDSLTISGKTMTWIAANNRFEATDSKSTVQAVTCDTFTSGNEATYGITVGTMNGYSTTIIWDRFEFTSITVDDDRINVGGTFELRYKIRYDYDDAPFDDTKGSVSGFTWDATNGWWKKTVTGSSSIVSTNYDETYVSITDSAYGLTPKQDVTGVNVITDRIRWDTVSASDTRLNINSASKIRVNASLEYDGHIVGSGDALSINGISLKWNSQANTWEVSQTNSTVQAVTYNSLSGSEATYGISATNNNGKSITVAWDRIEIYYEVLDDSRVGVGDSIEFRVKARLENDGHQLGGEDTITANIGSLSWVSYNGWFRGAMTQPDVGTYTFTVNSASEATYGITVFRITAENPAGVWDRIKITDGGVSDDVCDVDATQTVWFTAIYEYDSSPLDSTKGTLYVNGSAMAWSSANSRWEKTYSYPTVGKRAFEVNSVSDSAYGITAINDVAGAKEIAWTGLSILQTAYPESIHLNSKTTIRVQLVYSHNNQPVSGGVVSLTGATTYTSTTGSSGWASFSVYETAPVESYTARGVNDSAHRITKAIQEETIRVKWLGDFNIIVLDANGYALNNAEVEIYNGPATYWKTLHTDATGLISVEDAPCQNYNVKIYWQDVSVGTITFDLNRALISVTSSCTVYYGYVRVYESSDVPISDATVTLLWPNEAPYGNYQTDETGSTAPITQIPAGSYTLQVFCDNSAFSTKITVNQNFDIPLLISQLSAPYDDQQRALSYTTNTEVQSYTYNQAFRSLFIAVECSEEPGFFSVFLTNTFLSQLGIRIDDVHTLLDGTLIDHTVETYPSGYLLTITHSLCSPHDIEIVFSSVTLVATLTDSNTIPLDGALVRAYRGQTLIEEGYTDESGQIFFASLPSGYYNISTSWLGVPVQSDQLTITGDISYEATCSVYHLKAQFIDMFSDYLPGSSVTIYLPDGTVLTSGATDQDSVATFHQLPIGSYTVVIKYFVFSHSATVNLIENLPIQIQVPMLNINTVLFMLITPVAVSLPFYRRWWKKKLEKRMRMLIVCSNDLEISPTVEEMYRGREDIDVKSAGILPDAATPLTKEMVQWADKIFVMEKKHRNYVTDKYPEAEEKTTTLNIEEKYQRSDPALKRILDKKLAKLVPPQPV